MKITKQRLKEIIKEELAHLAEMGEDPDDWRDMQIEDAIGDGEADGFAGADRAVGYRSFQRWYDQAYDRAAQEKEKQSTLELPQVTDDTIKRMRQGLKRVSRKRSPGDYRSSADRFKKP